MRVHSRTCEVAELRDEHGGSWQRAPGAASPLGLADQHRLLQVRDFLVVLLQRHKCRVPSSQHGRACG